VAGDLDISAHAKCTDFLISVVYRTSSPSWPNTRRMMMVRQVEVAENRWVWQCNVSKRKRKVEKGSKQRLDFYSTVLKEQSVKLDSE